MNDVILSENNLQVSGAGALAVAEREKHEIQSAIIMAKQFPRDEDTAILKVEKAFSRPGNAEIARYSFRRGGAMVEGPTVALAREVARCFGNIRSGFRIVEVTDKHVHVKGFAIDLETNAYFEAEDKFERLVQRKAYENGEKTTKWVSPDERDLRELINKRAAILQRNCILQIIPGDFVDSALTAAQKTLRKMDNQTLTENREDTIRNVLRAFDKLGVSKADLEDWLSHPIEQITDLELGDLRGIKEAIKDGQSKASDYFTRQKEEEQEARVAAALPKALRAQKSATESSILSGEK